MQDIDLQFIEFYIKKKYNQRLQQYFNVNDSIATRWRKSSFPDKRMKEFCFKEGSMDVFFLLEKLNYKKLV